MLNEIYNLKKSFKKCDYENVFDILDRNNFSYSLNDLTTVLPKCDSKSLYLFLMYSISKKETTEKHLAACECLLYMEPYIHDTNNLIRWHILHALEINPNNIKILSWVIEVFGKSSNSPFSKTELNSFTKIIFENSQSNKNMHTLV